MKLKITIGFAISIGLFVSSCATTLQKDQFMEQNTNDKTTLIVTSSPNLAEMVSLKKYVNGVCLCY